MSAHSRAPESPCRQRTGLSPSELSLVIAALACEVVDGYGTAQAIAKVAGVSAPTVSDLLRTGWLERAGRCGRAHVLRGTNKAWRLYELGEGS